MGPARSGRTALLRVCAGREKPARGRATSAADFVLAGEESGGRRARVAAVAKATNHPKANDLLALLGLWDAPQRPRRRSRPRPPGGGRAAPSVALRPLPDRDRWAARPARSLGQRRRLGRPARRPRARRRRPDRHRASRDRRPLRRRGRPARTAGPLRGRRGGPAPTRPAARPDRHHRAPDRRPRPRLALRGSRWRRRRRACGWRPAKARGLLSACSARVTGTSASSSAVPRPWKRAYRAFRRRGGHTLLCLKFDDLALRSA